MLYCDVSLTQVVPVGLRTVDFGNCTEQRFSCSLNATSNTCGVELGPVQPSVCCAVGVCGCARVCMRVQLSSVHSLLIVTAIVTQQLQQLLWVPGPCSASALHLHVVD